MDVKQAFAELGLMLHASHAEAKAAYRMLAMRWHPDVNNGLETESRMKAINVAYALVCQHLDTLAKAAEQDLSRFRKQASNHAFGTASGFQAFDAKTGFRAGSKPGATGCEQPRQDLVQRSVQVSLFEAAFGCVKRVSGLEATSCQRCGGCGEFPGTWTLGAKCMKCFGRGQQTQPGGGMAPCAACKGSGVFRPAPPDCPACKGSGKTERRAWVVDVHIHAGTLDGAVVQAGDIRLRSGQAQAPRRFSFTVQLEKHPLFQLDHDRLSVGVPVSLWRWSLGGDVTVPTLDGSVRVSLPAKPTAMLVKNQGWPEAFAPHRRKPLFVLPRIIYPERLDAHERNLLQMLDARDQLPEVAGWKRHVQAWVEASAADTGL